MKLIENYMKWKDNCLDAKNILMRTVVFVAECWSTAERDAEMCR